MFKYLNRLNGHGTDLLFFGCSVIVLGLVRSLAGVAYPIQTFGYDFGFYLYALSHADKLNSFTLFGSAGGGYGNPLFFVLYHLDLRSDGVVILLNFTLSLLTLALVFWLSQDRKMGVIACLLYCFSVIQVELYSMFLLKTAIGIVILLYALKKIEEKKFKVLFFTTPLIILFHRTTSVFYFIVTGLYGVWAALSIEKRKLMIFCAGILISVIGWFIVFVVFDAITLHQSSIVRQGIFLYGENPLKFLSPYLFAGPIGFYYAVKNRKYLSFATLAAVSLFWILCRLPFYNRVLVYLDLSLIVLVAYAFSFWLERMGWALVVFIFIMFLAWQSIWFSVTHEPIYSSDDIGEIQRVTPTIAGSYVLATDANDAPWLLGYGSDGVRLGAPGLFENYFGIDEWNKFWRGSDQVSFLQRHPAPLVLYSQSSFSDDLRKCILPISEHYYKFMCPK